MYQKPAEQSFGADAMDYETVFVYRVDRNVQILNHCLDDIEVFCFVFLVLDLCWVQARTTIP